MRNSALSLLFKLNGLIKQIRKEERRKRDEVGHFYMNEGFNFGNKNLGFGVCMWPDMSV